MRKKTLPLAELMGCEIELLAFEPETVNQVVPNPWLDALVWASRRQPVFAAGQVNCS